MKPALLTDHPFGEAYANKLGVPAWAGALPGPKVEDWRFTPLRTLAKVPFAPATGVGFDTLPRNIPKIAGAARVVLVNGVYRKNLSDTDLGKGVEL